MNASAIATVTDTNMVSIHTTILFIVILLSFSGTLFTIWNCLLELFYQAVEFWIDVLHSFQLNPTVY